MAILVPPIKVKSECVFCGTPIIDPDKVYYAEDSELKRNVSLCKECYEEGKSHLKLLDTW